MSDLSNYQRLLAGELAIGTDPVLFEKQAAARIKKAAVDAFGMDDFEGRCAALRDYLVRLVIFS